MVVERIAPRNRKVRVLATLGPASRSPEMVRKLLLAGADAFRINMSHGTHEQQAELIAAIRALEKDLARPTTILVDLQGPKLRVGDFAEGMVQLRSGQRFTFDRDPTPGNAKRVELPHRELFEALQPRTRLLLDDGKIELMVERVDPDQITAQASGHLGLFLLHAAVLDPRLKHITIDHTLESYKSLIEAPMPLDAPQDILPGVVKRYDIPDLVRTLGPRLTFNDPLPGTAKLGI